MRRKKLGKTGLDVSPLGFGCMRLPLTDPENAESIDYDLATRMVRTAIDGGVNYVDTAFPYHGTKGRMAPGQSETFVGHALKNGYREKVYLATKLPLWAVKTRQDMDTLLDGQLKRLDTPYIDCYLAHNINASVWPQIKDLGLYEFLDQARKDGRIRHIGFSFHDNYAMFEEIVKDYDWEFGQIQYNYLDVTHQAGRAGLELMNKRGMGAIVMEPLRGGFLINSITEEMQAIFKKANPTWSLADWALRWLWDQPEVDLVLSGMTAMQHVTENLRIMDEFGQLSAAEREAVQKVREIFRKNLRVDCTGCAYCMPCPFGVNIPKNLGFYNSYHLTPTKKSQDWFRYLFNGQSTPGERYSNCTGCAACEPKCPQHIAISETMPKLEEAFGER